MEGLALSVDTSQITAHVGATDAELRRLMLDLMHELGDPTKCVICGSDLTDPTNCGEPSEDGDWVCDESSCRVSYDRHVTMADYTDDQRGEQ